MGAGGITSAMREYLVGYLDKPIRTGGPAHRLPLKAGDMIYDPELKEFVTNPQVNYLMRPDAQASISTIFVI